MATYQWPCTGRNRPEDVARHASCLKADFDLVSNTAATSLSCNTCLPSVLKPKILAGIEKGIAEARSNGYCPKWSEVDKSIFSKTILKNITTEAVNEARDRIPLEQFYGLQESYTKLHNKLVGQMPPTATNGEESSEEEESEPEENVGEEDGQEEGESEGSESGENFSENSSGEDGSGKNGSSEDSSGPGEDSEAQSDAGGEVAENQEIVTEQSIPDIIEDRSGFSATGVLEIKHQASVNKLEGMAPEILDCVSLSLKDFLRGKPLSSRSVHICGTTLLDNGDVEVIVRAKTREALQKLAGLGGWSQDFERTLISSPFPTYNVEMHKVETEYSRFRNRREKSIIIRKLAGKNRAIGYGENKNCSIGDIRWSHYDPAKMTASLIVEFLDPEQANQAIVRGLFWQGIRHGCERADKGGRLLRCSRCQAYGHLDARCTAPYRCGKCAGQHSTRTCESKIKRCASCGGPHRAGDNYCPEKEKVRKSLAFKNESTSQAIEPAGRATRTPSSGVRHSVSAAITQTEASMPSPVSLDANSAEDETTSKSDHSVPEADPPQDTQPDTATLRQEIEELKKEVRDLGTAVQANISAGTKRRAGEAFTGGVEAESSNMAAKRIRKEEPT